MNTNPLAPEMAWHNLAALRANDYPGRVVLLGTANQSPFSNPAHVLITAIGGRSTGSRNRKYKPHEKDKGTITTAFIEPCDDDPSLIIYPALCFGNAGFDFVASNGHQTTAIRDGLQNERSHYDTIETWYYEPDNPNYTPRISGSLELIKDSAPRVVMSSITKAPPGEYLGGPKIHDAVRSSWNLPSMLGIGYMLTTYAGNGNPIPSYVGPPMTIPLEGAPEEILTTVWDALNADTRVAIAARFVDSVNGDFKTLIKNGASDIIEA